ncbi:prepilin-type N-terminal cleavage/methylation domain-containing protein [Luteimonas sp. 100069]|uniref:prepilin-type N-terminal cleavage/methylation domain-containing protein n=1 Tax=Luteimonas sp. 100069 TaxID=2006109 RepID=UPI002101A6E3|nr:prepilin-type N-terminal cleavage/methylation domain-containing protein [Luteimonas sp. 100069]
MPTWASCHRADPLRRHSGFSLLELLVVLFLISVMAAMVAPRLQRTYQAIASSGDRAEVVRRLELLPFLARENNRALIIAPGDADALMQVVALPEGWWAEPVSKLHVEASGFCHPATLRVSGAGAVEDWPLSAPDCGVRDAP